MGREELSPHKIANELFGRLTPGEKVAIVGKHYEDSKMQEISLELEAALDLNVRIIHNNFDYEDFCFLRKAQKELVGSVRSNFLKWASYLSDAKIIRWYIVDHVALQNHVLDFKNIIGDFQYDWTHHSLKSRIQLEYYRSENVEYDRLEGLHRDSGGRDDVSRNTSVVKHPTYITGLTSVDSNQSFTNGTIDLESPFITFAATAKSELTMETSTEEGDAFIGVPLSTISVGTTSLTTNHNNTTLVVQMSGELGNQISKIVYGLGLKLFAKQKYGIDLGIKLRAQENSKWLHAMKDTKECFPKTRVLNFRECNTDEFLHMKKQQQMWVGDNDSKLLHFRGNDNFNQTHVEKGLSFLQSTLARMDIPPTDTTANITLPFLYADTFAVASTFLIDLYYEEIRDFFTFDDSVCKALPYPDETVMVSVNWYLSINGLVSN